MGNVKWVIGICLVFSVLCFSSTANASDVSTTLTQSRFGSNLTSNIGGLTIGYVKVGSAEVTNLSWHPDFKLGPLGLGLDVNEALGTTRPSGYENVVVRYVEYDDGQKGLRYGVVDNLTWGHGLLMKDYSTRATGPILLNNEQMATRGYVDFGQYAVRAMVTKSGLWAGRLEERVNPMLTLGQSYITDTVGVTPVGAATVQKVSGIGLDASVPLPLNLEGYAEYAQLLNQGGGLSVGLSWAYDLMVANANFLAEYRFLGKGFVPGYFDSDYQSNPVNLASVEATGNVKNGYLAQLGVNALGLASLKATYEYYNESNPLLMADLFAKLPADVEVTGYYQQPNFTDFRALTLENGAIMGGSVAYPLNPFTKLVVNYKKAYNPATSQVEESQYYEVRFNF